MHRRRLHGGVQDTHHTSNLTKKKKNYSRILFDRTFTKTMYEYNIRVQQTAAEYFSLTCWDTLIVLLVSGVLLFKKFFKYQLGCSSSCRGGDTAAGWSSFLFSSLLSLSLQLLSELLSFSPSSLDELSSSTDMSLLLFSILRRKPRLSIGLL